MPHNQILYIFAIIAVTVMLFAAFLFYYYFWRPRKNQKTRDGLLQLLAMIPGEGLPDLDTAHQRRREFFITKYLEGEFLVEPGLEWIAGAPKLEPWLFVIVMEPKSIDRFALRPKIEDFIVRLAAQSSEAATTELIEICEKSDPTDADVKLRSALIQPYVTEIASISRALARSNSGQWIGDYWINICDRNGKLIGAVEPHTFDPALGGHRS